MTDQERPVEERNDLLDDLLNAANVAVATPESSKQTSAAADEQPESAEQPAAPAAETAPTAAMDQGDSASGPAVAADASARDDASVGEAERVSDGPAVEATPVVASESADDAVVAEAAVEAATVEAREAGEAPAAVVSAHASEDAGDAPVAAAEAAPVAAAEAAGDLPVADAPVAEAEGASYTPVAEEESGRPRRVKDLEPGMELEGRVTSIALYGIFVDLGVGRDGLVHISEMSDTRIDSPSDLVQIGDTVKVRVKSVEPDGRRISLTMRSKERGDPRGRSGRKKPELDRERLASLRVGDNIEGTVTGIAPFGVFVDIGVGKDGLVHVSELAEGRVEKAEDAVQVGQTYTFKILEVDAEGTRISLSLRRAQRTQRLQQIEKGQILQGKISGLAPFGAFVDIDVGRDGLVHISELSEGRIEKVEDAVKVGDVVTVRVLDVDPQSKRISLSLRLEDRPREEPSPRGESPFEARESRGRRDDRGRRDERGPRPPRQEAPPAPAPEPLAAAEEPEEEFQGNATLEDLLSKFSSGKRERRRRQEEEDDAEDSGDRYSRRQRDAIRRTLQQLNDDE
jgi:predicted RNA-binding protein with RPS1 domain